MGLSASERKVLVFVALLALCAMLVRVGYVLGGPDLERTAEAQGDCTEVLSVGPETENLITEPFDITGNSFRVLYDVTSLVEEPNFPLVQITPMNEDGQAVSFIQTTEAGSFDENVTEGPGTFTLETTVSDAEYTITVEDCGSTPGGGADDQYNDTGNSDEEQQYDTPTPTPSENTDGNPPLMQSGGPKDGPVPPLPGGGCPPEYPAVRDGSCYR